MLDYGIINTWMLFLADLFVRRCRQPASEASHDRKRQFEGNAVLTKQELESKGDMRIKRKSIWSSITILLSSLLFIVSCSPVQGNNISSTKVLGMQADLTISSPEIARDAVLTDLRAGNPAIPSSDIRWDGEEITPAESVAIKSFLYSFRNWAISVVSPQVAPERKVFTVIVMNEETGFKWAGLVDAYGKIIRMGRLQNALVVPSVTSLPTISTSTPFPTNTLRPPTSTPVPGTCNDATFLEDVTIEDGTIFPPGKDFLKVWRLRNVGSCTWSTDYDLVFVGGNRMGAQSVIPLAETVKPGESVELGAYMIAPQAPGNYRGFWMLRNQDGKRFGVGADADDSLWVEIKVVGDESKYKYNFALDYCDAIWRSATSPLSCGDVSNPDNGSVQFLISPDLENRHENEATLRLHPNESSDGWIEGTYPPITIEPGDHFRAWVGCMAGYDLCDVTFYLAYVGDDRLPSMLGTWHEVFDNQVTVIDIDLTNLNGQSVQFILGMEANTLNVSSSQGFWFVPRIQR